MRGKISVLKPRKVVAILEKFGFTVPFHPGRDISPILLRQIAKDVGLTADEFLR
jgi:predicted RNA binding protein YcfA (HicA-like mRNA interferase family)